MHSVIQQSGSEGIKLCYLATLVYRIIPKLNNPIIEGGSLHLATLAALAPHPSPRRRGTEKDQSKLISQDSR